jgi:hypothetical protein
MHKFSQFNIEPPEKGFEGKKIKMSRVLNKEIVILDFRIEDTKIDSYREKGSDKCMYLQVSIEDDKHVIFTSGKALIEIIQKIPRESFPFTTTIIEETFGKYLFT